MLIAAMFIVFLQNSIRANLEQHFISFEGLAHLDWYFIKVG